MTELLFRIILPMGIMGGVVYLILLALRPATARLGPRMRKMGLVAVCLLMLVPLPFAASELAKGIDLGAATQTVRAAPTYQMGEGLGEAIRTPAPAEPAAPAPAQPADPGEPVTDGDTLNAAPLAEPEAAARPAPTLPQVLALVYLAGAAASLLFFALRYARLAARLRRDREPATDATRELYARLGAEMGFSRLPALYRSPRVTTPLLAGVLRPAIYLPAQLEDEGPLCLALRHELTHCRRGDLALKWLVIAASVVQWYIPLCVLLRRDFTQACEEACDAEVSAELSGPQRQAYAILLLEFSGKRMPGAAFTLSSPGKRMKERLGRLLRPAKPGRAARTAGVTALCLLVAAGLLASCTMAAGMGDEEAADDSSRESLITVDGPINESPYQLYKKYYDDILWYAEQHPEYFQGGTFGWDGEDVSWTHMDIELKEGGTAMAAIPYMRLDLPVYATLQDNPAAAACPVPAADPGHWPQEHPDVYTPEPLHRWEANFYAPKGEAVVAAADGVVVETGEADSGPYANSWGTYILVAHSPDETTLYASLGDLLAEPGQEVKKGEQIATVGQAEGTFQPHCNFALRGGYMRFDLSLTPEDLHPILMAQGKGPSVTSSAAAEWNVFPPPVEAQYTTQACPSGSSAPMDFVVPTGTDIQAVAYGRVTQRGSSAEWGDYLIVTHVSDWSTLYAHCGEVLAQEGDEVFRGQAIARVGDTGHTEGPGFHFQLLMPGVDENLVQTHGYIDHLFAARANVLQHPVPSAISMPRYFEEGVHDGVDLLAVQGDPIYSAHAGEVIKAEWHYGWGFYVRLLDKDTGYTTIYAQCNELLVAEGDWVTQGQQIATVGATGHAEGGAHCHFEIWDPTLKPVDPRLFIVF